MAPTLSLPSKTTTIAHLSLPWSDRVHASGIIVPRGANVVDVVQTNAEQPLASPMYPELFVHTLHTPTPTSYDYCSSGSPFEGGAIVHFKDENPEVHNIAYKNNKIRLENSGNSYTTINFGDGSEMFNGSRVNHTTRVPSNEKNNRRSPKEKQKYREPSISSEEFDSDSDWVDCDWYASEICAPSSRTPHHPRASHPQTQSHSQLPLAPVPPPNQTQPIQLRVGNISSRPDPQTLPPPPPPPPCEDLFYRQPHPRSHPPTQSSYHPQSPPPQYDPTSDWSWGYLQEYPSHTENVNRPPQRPEFDPLPFDSVSYPNPDPSSTPPLAHYFDPPASAPPSIPGTQRPNHNPFRNGSGK
ncbi:hypothetical protein V5O48_011065 [Marasmius crinis-equi]|uniref:Galectin n=1 Tax=Marasmius crinis-equi TaxID=585013 RepID=A0ABR3F6L6_9AGAR